MSRGTDSQIPQVAETSCVLGLTAWSMADGLALGRGTKRLGCGIAQYQSLQAFDILFHIKINYRIKKAMKLRMLLKQLILQ